MARPTPRISRSVPAGKRRPNERLRPKHHEFIRRLPCLACGMEAPSECAHVRSSGDGGVGLKPHSRFTVPLCGPMGCHALQHQIGETEFFAQLGIDAVDVALRLWTVTGDDDAGWRTIDRARQSIALHKAALVGGNTDV